MIDRMRLKQIIIVGILWVGSFFEQAYANYSSTGTVGVGGMANSIMEPVSFFADAIYTGCFVIGGAFLFASVIKYFEHRRSPLMVTISTVVFLAIAGVVLVALPFLSYFFESGVRYSLFR